jgi:hypothetical protein
MKERYRKMGKKFDIISSLVVSWFHNRHIPLKIRSTLVYQEGKISGTCRAYGIHKAGPKTVENINSTHTDTINVRLYGTDTALNCVVVLTC